jgi:hypothetical protein
MHLDRSELNQLLKNRKESAARAKFARSRAQMRIAEGFDRLTAELDVLLARYGASIPAEIYP